MVPNMFQVSRQRQDNIFGVTRGLEDNVEVCVSELQFL